MLASVGFTGMIDLNTILTPGEAYGLEWTPRFGYLADMTIATMYGYGYGELLRRTAAMEVPEIKWTAPFGMSVTLSIPPYPTEIRIPKAKDVPIEGIDPSDIEQLKSIYLYDAKLSKDKKSLITSGNYGFICAPTGIGDSIVQAAAQCDKLIESIHIPNMQYRTDILKSTTERYDFLERNNWL
jgi:phosphoribosylamine-glycine ligase